MCGERATATHPLAPEIFIRLIKLFKSSIVYEIYSRNGEISADVASNDTVDIREQLQRQRTMMDDDDVVNERSMLGVFYNRILLQQLCELI